MFTLRGNQETNDNRQLKNANMKSDMTCRRTVMTFLFAFIIWWVWVVLSMAFELVVSAVATSPAHLWYHSAEKRSDFSSDQEIPHNVKQNKTYKEMSSSSSASQSSWTSTRATQTPSTASQTSTRMAVSTEAGVQRSWCKFSWLVIISAVRTISDPIRCAPIAIVLIR